MVVQGAPDQVLRRPEHENYVFRILDVLRANPDQVVVFWEQRQITGAELAEAISGGILALTRAGVGYTSTVAVLTEPNSPAMLTARYAAHSLGAAVVYVRSGNPRSAVEAMSVTSQLEVLKRTGATVLAIDRESAGTGRALSGGQLDLRLVNFELPDRPSKLDIVPPAEPRYHPDRCAVVALTSGSTGSPKLISQSYRAWNAQILLLSANPDELAPPRILATTPIGHTTAPMIDAALAAGGSVILHENFQAAAVLRAFGEQQITHAYLAMPQLYRLLDSPELAGSDLSSLRQLIYSGTPAAPHRVAEATRVFGDALIQVYGTTEGGGITSLSPMDHREPELLGTVGRLFPWVKLQIRDPDSGRLLARGESGELWTTSPTVMDGYLGDEGLTAEGLDGGWLRTGDLGHWDRHGYLTLDGRVAEMVKVGGLKIYPTTVEQAISAHPAVAQVAVYGVRGADHVELVQAAVEYRPGIECSRQQLRDYVTNQLSASHAPSEIEVWSSLPLNDQGKPDKTYLRSRSRTIHLSPKG